MKSSGRTEKSVGNRSSMCEREGLKIGGCTATGLLKMQNNKRREYADSVYTVMGADTSVAAREYTPMFLFVAQNCCITSRKKKKERQRPLEVPPGSSRTDIAKLAYQTSSKCVVSTETSQYQ